MHGPRRLESAWAIPHIRKASRILVLQQNSPLVQLFAFRIKFNATCFNHTTTRDYRGLITTGVLPGRMSMKVLSATNPGVSEPQNKPRSSSTSSKPLLAYSTSYHGYIISNAHGVCSIQTQGVPRRRSIRSMPRSTSS